MRLTARANWLSRQKAIAISLVLIGTGAACGSSSSSKSLSSSTTAQLDQAIPQAMRQEGIPGAIVAVWSRSGNYVRAFGVADTATGSPMQKSFSHSIGSITKTFTVTAVLQLVDQGKVSLNDPISKYQAGVPNGDHITIRELARMQSGLFNYFDDQSFKEPLFANPYQGWSPDQLLQIAFSHPPNFPPGTDFEYNNTNLVLLGLVVEKVTGQPLASYVEQRVLKPLHLDQTAFPSGNQLPDPHAQGYVDSGILDSQGPPLNVTGWNLSWAGAAGAMYSNLNDMHTWAPALAMGTFLKPSTQAQRLQTVPFKGYPGVSYGLGIEDISGWLGHIGDLFGYNSLELYLPSQQASLVIFANIYPSKNLANVPVVALGNVVTKTISPGNVIPLSSAPED
jgi:D-alanyl-D-alanine carboxypeptidase